MFRFTIRDVLWLTVVVAMAIGWRLEYRRSPTRQLEFRASALEQAIKGHGFTVEHPSPFRVKVWNRNAIVDVNHEPSIEAADPFGPPQTPVNENPFGPPLVADPFGADPHGGKNPFGPNPTADNPGFDPFAPR